MQTFFRLAWNQEQNVDKKPEKALLAKERMRPSPVIEIPPLFKMKRKRSYSPDRGFSPNNENPKRRKMEQETDQLPHSLSGNRQPDAVVKEESFTNDCNESRAVNHSAAVPEQPAQSTSLPDSLSITNVFASKPRIQQEPRMVDVKNITDKVEPTELQQIIEHQFNLEILMKHRELRLIEQELAKCQIALEQLRRCEIVSTLR